MIKKYIILLISLIIFIFNINNFTYAEDLTWLYENKNLREVSEHTIKYGEPSFKEFISNFLWCTSNCSYDNEKQPPLYNSSGNGNSNINILNYVIKPFEFVDYSQYPVTQPRELSKSECENFLKKHKIKVDSDYYSIYEYDKNSIKWIARNIFNINDYECEKLYKNLIDEENNFEDAFSNKMYHLSIDEGIGGMDILPVIQFVKSDGNKYHISYNAYYGTGHEYDYIDSFYAIVELKKSQGKEYWSIYKNLSDSTNEVDIEEISKYAGSYIEKVYYNYGGIKPRELIINEDGTYYIKKENGKIDESINKKPYRVVKDNSNDYFCESYLALYRTDQMVAQIYSKEDFIYLLLEESFLV